MQVAPTEIFSSKESPGLCNGSTKSAQIHQFALVTTMADLWVCVQRQTTSQPYLTMQDRNTLIEQSVNNPHVALEILIKIKTSNFSTIS